MSEERTEVIAGTSPADKVDSGKTTLKDKLNPSSSTEETQKAVETEVSEPSEPQIDYKAELEKTKEKLEREKTTRQFEREARQRAERKLARQRSGENEETEETTELAKETDEVDLRIDAKFEAFQRSQQSYVVDKILGELSDNDDERELIRVYYESKIKPTGFDPDSILSDLKDAYFMANRARFEAQAFEKAQSKVKKDIAVSAALKASAPVGGEGREPPETQSRPLNAEEERFLKAMGKGATERFLKKIKQ